MHPAAACSLPPFHCTERKKTKRNLSKELKKEVFVKFQYRVFLKKGLILSAYYTNHTTTKDASEEERRRGAVRSGSTFCSASAHFVFLPSCASLTLMSNRQGLAARGITSKWVSWCVPLRPPTLGRPPCRCVMLPCRCVMLRPPCRCVMLRRPPCRCVMLYWRRQ